MPRIGCERVIASTGLVVASATLAACGLNPPSESSVERLYGPGYPTARPDYNKRTGLTVEAGRQIITEYFEDAKETLMEHGYDELEDVRLVFVPPGSQYFCEYEEAVPVDRSLKPSFVNHACKDLVVSDRLLTELDQLVVPTERTDEYTPIAAETPILLQAVVGHELGHFLLGPRPDVGSNRQEEQAADCFGGAIMRLVRSNPPKNVRYYVASSDEDYATAKERAGLFSRGLSGDDCTALLD